MFMQPAVCHLPAGWQDTRISSGPNIFQYCKRADSLILQFSSLNTLIHKLTHSSSN